jgi:hypothetical protein
MVQPAESLLRKDPTRSDGTNPAVRCPLLKSEMHAVLMVVANIFREQSLQMRMSTFQRDELLTQSEILEKETLPSAKEAYQHSEEEPDKAKHDQNL